MTDVQQRVGYGDGKEALLRATVQVVSRKGLRGLTFRAVAETAGVNNTLIAHHFRNRDGLLAATLEWSMERSLSAADLGKYQRSSEEFREALVSNVMTDPDLEIFQYEMILEATRREELRPAVQELYRRYVKAMVPGLVTLAASQSEALGRALFAALDGLMLQFYSHAITRDQLIEALGALEAALTLNAAAE